MARQVIVNRKVRPLIMLIGIAAILFAIGKTVDYGAAVSHGMSVPDNTVVNSSGEPSEKKTRAVDKSYIVPVEEPRVISIRSIGVMAYVQKVGVNTKHEMATPNNIGFTGWYNKSAAPGTTGVSIIDGHVSGRYREGVFKNLNRLEKGNVIAVQKGDMSWVDYTVTSKSSYDIGDAGSALFEDDPTISKELHLITCDGRYDQTAQTFDKRLIITASAD